MIKLPMQVQHDPTAPGGIRVREHGASAGWTVVECRDAVHARELMASYPGAAMPCWRNPGAVWNRGDDSFEFGATADTEPEHARGFEPYTDDWKPA